MQGQKGALSGLPNARFRIFPHKSFYAAGSLECRAWYCPSVANGEAGLPVGLSLRTLDTHPMRPPPPPTPQSPRNLNCTKTRPEKFWTLHPCLALLVLAFAAFALVFAFLFALSEASVACKEAVWDFFAEVR